MTPRWFLCMHALQRCSEMGVDRALVVAAIESAEVSWSSHGRRVAAKGQIAVVFDPSTRVVVTVLPWTQERYSRAG